MKFIKNLAKKIIDKTGYQIINKNYVQTYPVIHEVLEFMALYNRCKNYTMTSIERMYALYKAVIYIIKAGIKGDFVECGVWKGGSIMLIAYTLKKLGVSDRKIYLYDTFSGMTKPLDDEMRIGNNVKAYKIWEKYNNNTYNKWCYASIEEVMENVFKTGYPPNQFNFVKGKVEETIPNTMPQEIALLRLDTDWYSSTFHELHYLFPLLSYNGVIIIDDYGFWSGCKMAVDEYFSNKPIYFVNIDHSGIVGIKTFN